MLLTAVLFHADTCPAQSDKVVISLRDTTAYPGQIVHLPLKVWNLTDTIEGYQVEYTLDRPDLIAFPDTIVFDTAIACVDPPSCTIMDTTVDTIPLIPLDANGTLTSGWEILSGTNLGNPTFVRVTAIADFTGDNIPPGIPPVTLDTVLIELVVAVDCHPDTISGVIVNIVPNKFDFSNQLGQLILPVSSQGARVTVLAPVAGDLNYSGSVDAVDLSKMIDCILRSDCPICDAVVTDFTCDGVPDAVDLSFLIDHIFFGGPAPSPCP